MRIIKSSINKRTSDVLAGAYKQDDSIIIDAEDLRGKSREEIEEILKDAPVGSEIIHIRNTSNRFNIDTIIEKQQHYSSNYHQGFSSPHDWKTLNEFWAVGGKEAPYIDKTIYEAVNGKNKYYGLTSDVLKAHGIDQPIDESTSVEASDSYNLDDETYKYVTNVDGYWIYRAIVDGKGVWRAMTQDSNESQFEELSFPISYDQARGFEPIDEPSAITKLRKDLGKKLLPKAGQSIESTEDLSIYPEGFKNAYTLAKNDFMSDYTSAHVNVQIDPDDPYAQENEVSIYISGFNPYGKRCARHVTINTDLDSDTIYQVLEETAQDIGIRKGHYDIKSSTIGASEVFIEDIIDGLEDNGYDLNDLSSIKEGLWALFGYQGKDANDVIEDLVAGGFIDSNVLIDSGRKRIYSDTEYDEEEYNSEFQDESIEDIVAELEEGGYDVSDINDVKMGLGAYLGYDSEDIEAIVEDMISAGYIELEDGIYSDTAYRALGGTANGARIREGHYDIKNSTGSTIKANKSSSVRLQMKEELMDQILSEIKSKLKEIMTSPKFGFPDNEWEDYSGADIYLNNDGYFVVTVYAEVSYGGLVKLMDTLNTIVEKYDRDAYFDAETSGRCSAYIDPNNIPKKMYPKYKDVSGSEEIEGASKEVELDPEESMIDMNIDQYIIVDSEGGWNYDSENYDWASSDGEGSDWYSETGVRLDDPTGVVEKIDELIEPHIPIEPGTYRVQGYIELYYTVSGVYENRYDYTSDDYSSDINSDLGSAEYNKKLSKIEDVKVTKI